MTTVVAPPTRSTKQREDALARANEIRSARARLKKQLKARQTTVGPLLADPPDWIETMSILELLLALPQLGRVKADRVLQRARVSPSKTIGGLTERQRREIAGLLR